MQITLVKRFRLASPHYYNSPTMRFAGWRTSDCIFFLQGAPGERVVRMLNSPSFFAHLLRNILKREAPCARFALRPYPLHSRLLVLLDSSHGQLVTELTAGNCQFSISFIYCKSPQYPISFRTQIGPSRWPGNLWSNL